MPRVDPRTGHCLLLVIAASTPWLAGCEAEPEPGPAATSGRVERILLRSRPIARQPGQPKLELSNLRFGEGMSKLEKLRTVKVESESFEVDWQLQAGRVTGKWTLVVKSAAGGSMRMDATPQLPFDVGTMAGEVTKIGMDDDSQNIGISEQCEMYVVLSEADMEFKISNSITVGDASTTPTREPTDDERAKLGQTPGVSDDAEQALP